MTRFLLVLLALSASVHAFALDGYKCRSACLGIDTEKKNIRFFGMMDGYGITKENGLMKIDLECRDQTENFGFIAFATNRGIVLDARNHRIPLKFENFSKRFEKYETLLNITTFSYSDHSRLHMSAVSELDCVKAEIDEDEI